MTPFKSLLFCASAFIAVSHPSVLGEEIIDFAKVKEMIETKLYWRTNLSAGSTPSKTYFEVKGVLVGFECAISRVRGFDTFRGYRAIYRTEKGLEYGEYRGTKARKGTETVIAKPGYAVSEVTGYTHTVANRRIKVTFARIKGTELDLSDTYESPWIGEYNLGQTHKVSTKGGVPVGVYGTSGGGVNSLGMVVAGSRTDPTMEALVLVTPIKDKKPLGNASGFVYCEGQNTYVISNLHVLEVADGVILKLFNGDLLKPLAFEAASDRDLVRILVEPVKVRPLKLAPNSPQIGQSIFTLGDSGGRQVITSISGKVLGVGPGHIEVDAGFILGNSGGPIVDDQNQVVGVSTLFVQEQIDWRTVGTRFEQVRRFGTRLDHAKWLPIQMPALYQQTAYLKDVRQFALDLNALAPLWATRGVKGTTAALREKARTSLYTFDDQDSAKLYRVADWHKELNRFKRDYCLMINRGYWSNKIKGQSLSGSKLIVLKEDFDSKKAAVDKFVRNFQELPKMLADPKTKWVTPFLKLEAGTLAQDLNKLSTIYAVYRAGPLWGQYVARPGGTQYSTARKYPWEK